MNKVIKGIGSFSLLLFLTAGNRVFAACSDSDAKLGKCVNIINPPTGGWTASAIITNITNWVTGLVAAIAIIFIILGGLKYVTAGGNKEQIESAKQTLTYAVIGIIVVVLARVIISLATGTAGAILPSA